MDAFACQVPSELFGIHISMTGEKWPPLRFLASRYSEWTSERIRTARTGAAGSTGL